MENKKIIDYKIVRHYVANVTPRQELFEKAVLDLIKQGYIPIGGVAFSDHDWLQAMVKYED
jgi:hypothetical protein